MLIRPALPVGWVHPSVPGEPSHSSPWGFELPDVNFLRFLNAHPRDRHIKFYADTHVYFVNGVKTLGSVTGLVHSLAQPFDADDVILRMSRGTNWPRPGYLRTVWQPEDVLELQQMPSACDLVSLLVSSRRDEQAICDAAKALRSRCPQAASFVDRLSLTTAEIKYKWDTNRDEAARAGTWMHFTFEVARLARTNQSLYHSPLTNVLVTEHPLFYTLWARVCGGAELRIAPSPASTPNPLYPFPTHSSHRVFGHMILVIIEFRERLG
jgi:hypothetical protein